LLEYTMSELDDLRERLAATEARLDAALTENATIRLRACDAHAAVFRAMRAPQGEALAALQDDGYVHEAVHRVLDGSDGTAEARWDEATRKHIEALVERAIRAEAELDLLRGQLNGSEPTS
jgi:hypothetical protein